MDTRSAAAPRRPTEHLAHLWDIAARLQALFYTSEASASGITHRFIAASGRLSILSQALTAEAAAGDAGARRIEEPLQREVGAVGRIERTFHVEHAAIARSLMALIDLAGVPPTIERRAQANMPHARMRVAADSLVLALIPVEEQTIDLTERVREPLKRTARVIGNLGVRIALGGDPGAGGVAHLAQHSRRLKELTALFHDLATLVEAYQHGITGTLGGIRREILELGALNTRAMD